MTRYRRRRWLLWAGIGAPLLAAVTAISAAALFPSFDHATQYISELAGPAAPAASAGLFNAGVILAGIAAGFAGAGFGLTLIALGGGRIPAAIVALAFLVGAVGLVLSGVYTWPDPRHRLINLGLFIQLAPIFLIWGLWKVEGVARLRGFLAAVVVAMAAMTVITRHLVLPGTVNDDNVGWWERAFAILLVGWVGVTAVLLERRLISVALEEANLDAVNVTRGDD